MCYVTSTELKKNLSHFLALSQQEEVYITKNGKIIAVLSDPKAKSFFDFLEFHKTIIDHEPGAKDEDLLLEGIEKKCGF